MRRDVLCQGIRFGLLLQLAVGPVCLYVLRTGCDRGVYPGMIAVAAVTLVDSIYILLAGLGVTRWAEPARRQRLLQYGGAAVIAVFALDIFVSVFGFALVPSAPGRWLAVAGSNSFLAALTLTASNPLTIVFWAGVFSTKVASERYGKTELRRFSLGCIMATAVFLTAVALAGALGSRLLPAPVLRALNVAVACALLYLAVKLALRRPVLSSRGQPTSE